MTAAISDADSPSIEFLDLTFASASIDDVLASLAEASADQPFAYIVTPNVDHIVRLRAPETEHRVWAAYRGAALMLCDSRVLALLARLRGVALPVVPGSDLTARIFAELLRPGDRVTIIGGGADTLAQLERRYPEIHFRQHLPPMGLRRDAAAIAAAADFVAAASARFVFFAVGSPQQELLALAVKERGAAFGTGLCIGAAIDFLVGAQTRAPRLVQRLSLEWLHRLLGDPRRLGRRYLVEGPKIFVAVARWKRHKRQP